MSGNTRNAIEAFADEKEITLAGASLGSDRNAIEQLAADLELEIEGYGDDDNALEAVIAASLET